PTSASPLIGMRPDKDLLNVPQIKSAFERLTQGTVHVDAKVLVLPVDDPALDAIARGEFATMEVLRFWLYANWEKYWVAHEGCEPYVSFVMHGDVASVPTTILGIGTYDESKSYRISMSWVHESLRVIRDPDSPVPDQARLLGDSEYNWVNFLFAHEIGHTIGMHHPFHSGWDAEGAPDSNQRFENVWTVMGYDEDGRLIDFSTVDIANFQRSRVGYLLQRADVQGLGGSAAWTQGVGAAETFDWLGASQPLWHAVKAQYELKGSSTAPMPDDFALRLHEHPE
ncbi:MAG TPA: hypothetical protein VI818_03025, partial [Candidatus Thermoplasmatota archaeon]|nr:hypothetical protein [Candidatus Thermoplasmatota archaeon]